MLTIKTPGKINLFLKILNRREDGYHDIETIFLPLKDIYDHIYIKTDSDIKGITINSNTAYIPSGKSNLCYKAAKIYADEAEIDPSWEIYIEKNIPIAAGLGGGSSDAAAVLILLQKKFNALSPSKLKDLASMIGADVPFFLEPSIALGRGIGDKLEILNGIDMGFYLIIVAPLFPISAKWAYSNFFRPKNVYIPNIEELIAVLREKKLADISDKIYNDLSFAIYRKFPLLSILKNELLKAGAIGVEITGSGPTLFGIAEDEVSAKEIISKIDRDYKEGFIYRITRIGWK